MNHHTTTHNKPSTMDHLKDKAANLVHKVADKMHGHDDTTSLNNTHDPLHYQNTADPRRHKGEGAAGPFEHQSQPLSHHQKHEKHSGPLHTGAAVGDSAVPHGNTIDRAAYQQQHMPQHPVAPAPGAPVTDTNAASGLHHPAPAGPTGTTNVPTYAQNIAPTAAGVVPTAHTTHDFKHDPLGHHGQHQQHQQQQQQQQYIGECAFGHPVHHTHNNNTAPVNTNNSTGLSNTNNNAGLSNINSSTVPGNTNNSALDTSNDKHDTVGYRHGQLIQQQHQPQFKGTCAYGHPVTTFDNTDPVNTNNSTDPVNAQNFHQSAPVHTSNAATTAPAVPTNTVPAMGAPGTTTAAGTHIPGEYNTGTGSAKPVL